MISLGELLRAFAEPVAPLVRERLVRALPEGSRLDELRVDGSTVTVGGLLLPAGPLRVVVDHARAHVSALGFLRGAAVTLGDAHGTIEVDHETRGAFRFTSSGGERAWATGALVITFGELRAEARVEVADGRVVLEALRLVGEGGTSLVGRLELRGARLEGTLVGTAALVDLLDATRTGSPLGLDPTGVTAHVELRVSGTSEAPVVSASLRAGAIPLRRPGHKRFVPYASATDVTATARISPRSRTFSAECELCLPGASRVRTSAARGVDGGTVSRLRIERLGPAAIRPLLALFGVDGLGHARGEVSGELVVRAPPEGPALLEGDLAAPELGLTVGSLELPIEGCAATLSGCVRRPSLRVTGTFEGGALTLTKGEDGRLDVALRNARASALVRLSQAAPERARAALAGTGENAAFYLPEELAVDLDLCPAKGATDARITISGPGTRLVTTISVREGRHVGSRAEGQIAMAHAAIVLDAGSRLPAGARIEGGSITLDLGLEGDVASTRALGTIELDPTVLTLGERAMRLGAARASLHVTRRFVALHEAHVEVGEGRVALAGCAILGENVRARLSVSARRVAVDALTLLTDAPLRGDVSLYGDASIHAGTVLAWANARVDAPSYPALPRATERLEKLGLPPLATEGDGPLELVCGLEAGVVTVPRLRFTVPGLRVGAHGRATLRGEELRATATVSAQPAWLARSRLLSIPATLAGTIEVPVTVEGSLSSPEAKSPVLAALLASLRRGIFRSRAPAPLALPERPMPVLEAPFEAAPDDALTIATIARGTLPHEHTEQLALDFVSARPKSPHPE